jgi:Ca-activated chloride channel family protein
MSSLACALKSVQGERVALTNVSVSAILHDLLAEVTMCQSYRNEEPVNIEAVYTFPLPLDAVLLDLQVEIGGRVLKGVVVEKKFAEEKYEDAVAAGDAAVMLEQLEPGLYTMNVGNLLPHENATITFSYSILYRWVGERLRIFIPTTIATRFGDSPHQPHQAPESSLSVENHFSLQMEIFGNLREAQFTCPSHQVSLARQADKVVVSLKQEQAAMDRDFILNVKALKASRSFAICGPDGDGAAAVASFQPFFPGLQQPRPLSLAIVIDCSGSMQGDSIEQAKKALEGILDSLQPSDQIALIAFGNSTHALWERLTPCSPANREVARRFAKQLAANMGGTEIGKALQTTYKVLGDINAADILLVTDGEVSSWQPVVQEATRVGHRIFTVGVGNAVSEAFVRELAHSTGGECELVAPREDMAERVIRHFERMRAPRAKRVVVQWPAGACDIAPSKLGSVFDGDTVISTARFDESTIRGSVVLEIETETGETARQELTIAAAPSSTTQDTSSTVARFAAAARLKEQDAVGGLATALRYRLVSPWTNWLVIATRPEGTKAQNIPAIRKVLQTETGIGILCCLSREVPATPMPPSAMPSARMTRGMPLWSKSSADTPQSSSPNSFTRLISNLKQTPSQKTATKIVVMLRTVPEIEWHEIALWAEREGHPALSQRSSDFWNLVRSGPLQDLNELQANEGFEILKEAHRLGFKLSNGVLKEAQRLGIDLR